MATTPPPASRAYRAACPNCGASVEFASAASASAVCSFCRSTLVREGQALRRIGVAGELFDDHSPLQLGASGRRQGLSFTLVGRLQYGYDGGTWNEWHALFDNGRSAWLSEDNGAYVLSFEAEAPTDAPQADGLMVGGRCVVDGRAWDVASVVRARLIAAQGELPAAPRLEGAFVVADLRNAAGEVGTLDYSDPEHVTWSSGQSVALEEFALQGLRESSEKTLASRAVPCPSCGASLEVKLASTQSATCAQCHAVVDLSADVGSELAHYAQNNSGVGGLAPQIALGSSGELALGGVSQRWQVVGYMERCDVPAPGSDDEQTFWREYLLYHRTEGFAFLVDAEDGWSWVKPLTGAPQVKGDQARWNADEYRRQFRYDAKVTWVLGEFYWRVQRDETAQVTDYHGIGTAGHKRLSREQVAGEVTWSAGETLSAGDVADAFALPAAARAAMQRDAAPLSTSSLGKGAPMLKVALVMLVLFILMAMMLSQCSADRCDELRSTFGESSAEYRQCVNNRGTSGVRTGGGSYGGYSSGGGHK